MDTMNNVSLWFGNFDKNNFDEYFEIKYTADGDSIASLFEKDFSLGYYDRDLVEKFWSEDSSDDITILLEDFSYDDQLIEQFKDVQIDEPYNAVILIYDYKYDGKIKISNYKNSKLNFIGSAIYNKE
ncbi:immunity 22 family protein [Listeria booriae]|nr:immunity 22 family protein [Listeria booriae]